MLLTFAVFALLIQCVFACNMNDPRLTDWAEQRVKTLGNCSVLSAGSGPVSYKVPRVKLVVYHNDEHEVIVDFLQYNSYVFGFKSIVVIDQDSQLDAVCRTLALFQHCGTEVITTASSFLLKGATLTSVMLKYKNTFLIPLDADELILPFSRKAHREVSVNRDEVWKAFHELPIDGRKYKFHLYATMKPNASVCADSFKTTDAEFRRGAQSDVYFTMLTESPRSKTFFHSHGFISTDDGNHYGLVKHDKGINNVHPAVAANMTHYFAVLRAQMIHYLLGGYRGAKDKFERASSHMGFTGDSNCSAPGRVGVQYCVPCKLFINGSDHGAKYYMDQCKAHPRAYPMPGVASWFRDHTMSMEQLTGVRLFSTV